MHEVTYPASIPQALHGFVDRINGNRANARIEEKRVSSKLMKLTKIKRRDGIIGSHLDMLLVNS
jgi:hypothetical protein